MASIIVVMIVRGKQKEKEEAWNNGKKTAGSISWGTLAKKITSFLNSRGTLLKTIDRHHDTLPVLFAYALYYGPHRIQFPQHRKCHIRFFHTSPGLHMRTATHHLPNVRPFSPAIALTVTQIRTARKTRLLRISKSLWRRVRHEEGPAGARLNLAWGIPPARGHGWSHSTLDLKVGLLKVPLLPRGTAITIPAVLEMKAGLGQRPFPCLWPLLRKITQMIEMSVTSFFLPLSSPATP